MGNLYTENTIPNNIRIGTTEVLHVYVGTTLVWTKPTTTTTTTTAGPGVNFNMSYNCTGSNATITINSFTNGSGYYQANTTPQTSLANAYSGSFMDVSSSYNYYSIANGTWYVVVRDKYNTSNSKYRSVSYNCGITTTTTTTLPPTTTTTTTLSGVQLQWSVAGGKPSNYGYFRIYRNGNQILNVGSANASGTVYVANGDVVQLQTTLNCGTGVNGVSFGIGQTGGSTGSGGGCPTTSPTPCQLTSNGTTMTASCTFS